MEIGEAKKWMSWCAISLLIGGGGITLGQALFGHILIDILYEGSTGTFLDGIIKGKHIRSVKYYYAMAGRQLLKVTIPILFLGCALLIFARFSSRWLLGIFLAIDMVFIILGAVNLLATAPKGLNLSLGMDWGYAETFQYAKEFGILILFFLFLLRKRYLICLAWQGLFIYILLDDSLQIHEKLGLFLAEFYHFPAVAGLRGRDLGELMVSALFGSLILSLLGIGYYYANSMLRRISHILLGLLALLLLFGIVFDMLAYMITIPSSRLSKVFNILEDGGEMVSITVIAWYVHALIGHDSLRVRTGT